MSTNRTQLTEDAIKKIVDGMPGGIDAFCTDWGWLQFARKIEAAHGITQQTTIPALTDIKVGQKILINLFGTIEITEATIKKIAASGAHIKLHWQEQSEDGSIIERTAWFYRSTTKILCILEDQ